MSTRATFEPDDVPAGLRGAVAGRRGDELDAGSSPAASPTSSVSGVAGNRPDGDIWLRSVPHLVNECLDTWELTVDGRAAHGECAIVIPVRRIRGGQERLALKVSWPHAEARHEHLALRAWRGVSAVRLVAADPARWALLLERCDPATSLHEMPALDACETIGTMHARLRHPALPQLDTASAWCARIAERLVGSPPPLPPRFVQQGVRLARDLPQDPGIDAALVHADLHDDNVMATRRAGTVGGLVAIDPKPVAGEPALAVAPLLWNRQREMREAYNVRNHLRFRVDYACDPMGVDPPRARAWAILRVLDNARWHADDARHRPGAASPDLIRAVTIIKAMQG